MSVHWALTAGSIGRKWAVNINSAELQAQLSAEDYETFIDTFTTLGHVGEGHC